jgi:hypothetical protein
MIISLLNNKNFNLTFIDLHVEQTFTNLIKAYELIPDYESISKESELASQQGIYTKRLSKSPLQNIFNELNKSKLEKYTILDFDNLLICSRNLHSHILNLINLIIKKKSKPVLINIDKNLYKSLELEKLQNKVDLALTDSYKDIIIGDERNKNELYKICKTKLSKTISFLKIKDETFESDLIKYLKKYSKPTTLTENKSSSVNINQYINIKKLIEENISFLYYCIYRLARKMINNDVPDGRKWNLEQGSKYVLFCQTLNGSFIASVLSDLLSLDIAYLDHIGPLNKLYAANFGERIKLKKEYIVVADIICFATEVKIAKNIIQYAGGIYIGNISIVRIKTVNIEDRYKDEIYLYDIRKKKNPLNYEIKVDI